MKQQSESEILSTAVVDGPVLSDEELKRLATIFDVFIDVDFYLKYAKETEQ